MFGIKIGYGKLKSTWAENWRNFACCASRNKQGFEAVLPLPAAPRAQ
ncbi:hypothetical protein A2U01_0061014, partial [Trifolium medium]|nr:hypothetical protein [Trifolium medium]